nr:hypothetical protein [Pseudodesulfovibrio sp.]
MQKERLVATTKFVIGPLVVLVGIYWFCAVHPTAVNSLFDLVASFKFTAVYSALIIVFARWQYVAYKQVVRRTEVLVKDATQELEGLPSVEEFAPHFRGFDEWMQGKVGIRHIWSEYKETLIHPDPSENSDLRIRNTEEAYIHFNEKALLGPRANKGFYSSMPNLLTGLGILGTFIGLMAGIFLAKEGLQSDNQVLMKQALDDLLSGASLAFITSIVGMTSSMFFSAKEKEISHGLSNTISNWNRALDARVERITPENLGVEQLKQLEVQSIHLETFVNEVAFNIAEAVGQQMDNALVPTMKRLIESVEGLREDRAESNQQMLHDIVEKFTSTMKEAAGKEMEALSSTLNAMNSNLGPLINHMSEAQREMQGAATFIAEEITKSYQESSESFSTSMDSCITKLETGINEASDTLSSQLAETFDGAVDQLNHSLVSMDTAAVNISKTFDDSNQKLSAGLDEVLIKLSSGITEASEILNSQLVETFEGAVGRLNQSVEAMDTGISRIAEANQSTGEMVEGVRTLILQFNESADILTELQKDASIAVESLKETAATIKAGGEEVADSLNTTQRVVENLTGISREMKENQTATSNLWSAYVVRFENVDTSLERVFEHITDHLDSYGNVMDEYLVGVDKQASEIVKHFSGAVMDLGNTVEDIADNINRFEKTTASIVNMDSGGKGHDPSISSLAANS